MKSYKYLFIITILLTFLTIPVTSMAEESAEDWYNKGNKAYELGDTVKSCSYYLKAIELKPKFIVARHCLALNYQDLGMYEKSIVQLEEILKIDPSYGEIYYDLGISYYNLKNKDKAIESFNNYLSYNTSDDKWARKAKAYIKEMEQFVIPMNN